MAGEMFPFLKFMHNMGKSQTNKISFCFWKNVVIRLYVGLPLFFKDPLCMSALPWKISFEENSPKQREIINLYNTVVKFTLHKGTCKTHIPNVGESCEMPQFSVRSPQTRRIFSTLGIFSKKDYLHYRAFYSSLKKGNVVYVYFPFDLQRL